jgi:guanine nucleotide-binding protein subunit alpha
LHSPPLANLTSLFPSLTQATDTQNIQFLFATLKETILQSALKQSRIL